MAEGNNSIPVRLRTYLFRRKHRCCWGRGGEGAPGKRSPGCSKIAGAGIWEGDGSRSDRPCEGCFLVLGLPDHADGEDPGQKVE